MNHLYPTAAEAHALASPATSGRLSAAGPHEAVGGPWRWHGDRPLRAADRSRGRAWAEHMNGHEPAVEVHMVRPAWAAPPAPPVLKRPDRPQRPDQTRGVASASQRFAAPRGAARR